MFHALDDTATHASMGTSGNCRLSKLVAPSNLAGPASHCPSVCAGHPVLDNGLLRKPYVARGVGGHVPQSLYVMKFPEHGVQAGTRSIKPQA